MADVKPSLSLVQIFDYMEPVTLDFLDAELEDSNKEEVNKSETSSSFLNGVFNVSLYN